MHNRSPVLVFRRVIYALLIRELKTRFGAQRFGVAWAIVDPLIQVGVMVAIFGYISQRMMPNVDYAVYVAIGIVPWFMFGDVINRGMKALEANRGLMVFRQVKPLDAFIARTLLEVLTYIVVFAAVMAVLAWLDFELHFRRPFEMLAACVCLFFMAFGIGLLFLSASVHFPEAQKLVPIILRLGYFTSGIIVPMSIIPQQYREYLYWNPVVHVMEIVREAFFPSFQGMVANWYYVIFVALALMFAGMASYHVNRERMTAQ